MSDLLELRKISLTFRRVSSNLLKSERENADVNLARFMKYIEDVDIIKKIVHEAVDGVQFNYEDCFFVNDFGRGGINIPVDEKKHLKAQYDYAFAIIDDEKNSVYRQTMQNYRSAATDKIQEFLANSFKPMIDYINDAISMEMLIQEELENKSQPVIVQKVENNYGTMNTQGSGAISSNNETTVADNIADVIERLLPSLEHLTAIDEEIVEDVKDDLESIKEQLQTRNPKKSRLQKALNGVKKFVSDFSLQLSVAAATKLVNTTDWANLIMQLEFMLQSLPR